MDEPGWALVTPDGRFRFEGQVLRCALGKGGVVPAERKQEGDGATPAARLPLRRLLYRADRMPPPPGAVPVEPLSPEDGWCDDPADRAYNRPVRLPHAARHEALWRQDGVYDLIGILGWNDAPVQRGRGSAIFLHLARPDFSPTEGCIALALPDLRQVLARGLLGIEVRAEG
ncbi:L,D-transpeptidase family protein [Falsiroseomonas tokyonensis]|uniref:L,D-transpeptidase n=1 Tax=Falsiroseomonas tokyonensis TaxID=430521 RepID=A0ABV7BQK9_9PROT|nr:L,D-transpeptidase family protein [Falsiroseomonas tokyonensis]MBU8537107.1 L,D-transpeptidase family protein [Falsiroseomonas tokyonensis]